MRIGPTGWRMVAVVPERPRSLLFTSKYAALSRRPLFCCGPFKTEDEALHAWDEHFER